MRLSSEVSLEVDALALQSFRLQHVSLTVLHSCGRSGQAPINVELPTTVMPNNFLMN